jgi:hypothetical protein
LIFTNRGKSNARAPQALEIFSNEQTAANALRALRSSIWRLPHTGTWRVPGFAASGIAVAAKGSRDRKFFRATKVLQTPFVAQDQALG